MTGTTRSLGRDGKLLSLTITFGVLSLALAAGLRPSTPMLVALIAAFALVVILLRPWLALPAIALAALMLPAQLATGTEVTLNVATILIPLAVAVYFLHGLVRGRVSFVASATNAPLILFALAAIISLLVGIATWDHTVLRAPSFTLVQLAQWSIFAFAAAVFLLAANLLRDERKLQILTNCFLLVGGSLAITRLIPAVSGLTAKITTMAFIRAPFWVLLASLAAGQILFNREAGRVLRAFFILVIIAALSYAFVVQRDAASNWVGVGVALSALVWLRYRRLRWPLVALLVILAALGILLPEVYQFAGGDAEWDVSGGSRLALSTRVIEVTLRNPITGLGPAAYRLYAGMRPLAYGKAYWLQPQISSHNNYLDILAHTGITGLVIFSWFVIAYARTCLIVRKRHLSGFASGYVNAMLAVGLGSLVIMALADWLLPFVYNIGFSGFQASLLVWLFLGGVVALENPTREGNQLQGE